MIDERKLKFYTEEEIRKMIKDKEPYVYVDDGITEVIIKNKIFQII